MESGVPDEREKKKTLIASHKTVGENSYFIFFIILIIFLMFNLQYHAKSFRVSHSESPGTTLERHALLLSTHNFDIESQ